MAKLRMGILSTARIARQFIAAVAPSNAVEVVAVASRDLARAQIFAGENGVPCVHGSYEALLADARVDAIYLPLPNSLHAEWAIRAAEAGKHVLCEKPLAVGAAEARSMFEAARAHGVVLVEGFPYRAQPYAQALRRLVVGGSVGRLLSIQAAIGFTVTDRHNIRLDPALAGGVLMDAGTYPVSFIRLLTGERPTRVHAMAQWHPQGVDQTLIASLEHASGALAQVSCSLASSPHRQALIVGEHGVIQTGFFNQPPQDQPLVLRVTHSAAADEVVESPVLNGFRAEAESFERCVRAGAAHWTGATPEESIDIAATLEAMLASARSGRIVEVNT